MTRASVKVLALVTGLSALPLMIGLPGCASDPYDQGPGHRVDGHRTTKPDFNQIMDPRIEDSRTAARVREALAAGADYRYDGVKVIACSGVVQLSGFVNTGTQRNRAGAVTAKVEGVRIVENNLTVRD